MYNIVLKRIKQLIVLSIVLLNIPINQENTVTAGRFFRITFRIKTPDSGHYL